MSDVNTYSRNDLNGEPSNIAKKFFYRLRECDTLGTNVPESGHQRLIIFSFGYYILNDYDKKEGS